MAIFTTEGIDIIGISAAVPTRVEGEAEFKQRFDERSVDKFIKSTGIRQVHLANEEQTASDLGYAAAERLLTEFDIHREKIGVLVFATLSPDYRRPATSGVLQMRLGLSKDCAALDVGHGCAGFVYGHQVMESLLMVSETSYGLLIVAETAGKLPCKSDHSSMMCGDAGAAILYGRRHGAHNTTILRADGSRFRTIIIPAGGFRDINPTDEEILCHDNVVRSKRDLYMDGMGVFSFSTTEVPDAIKDYLAETGTKIDAYHRYFLHQANNMIIKRICQKMEITLDKVPISFDRYGNTSGAAIPLTICDYYGTKEGDNKENVLCFGFGVGLAWGGTSLTISPNMVLPVMETDTYFEEGRINMAEL